MIEIKTGYSYLPRILDPYCCFHRKEPMTESEKNPPAEEKPAFTPFEITTHKVNGLNEALTITVMDEPGPGGAHHQYVISYAGETSPQLIDFQYGPIAENGVNGISIEALLAIVAHRLECFQAGPFACTENGLALTKVNRALQFLLQRTQDRTARGVEGTSKI